MSVCLGSFCGKFHDELQGSSDDEDEDDGANKKKNDFLRNPNRHKKKNWWGGTKPTKKKEADSGGGNSKWPFSMLGGGGGGESSGGGTMRWTSNLTPITVKVKMKNAQAATASAMKLQVVNKSELPGSLNSISQLPNLHTIEMIRCEQINLPPGLPDMDTLAVVRMSHNKIRKFADDLAKCNKLEHIVMDWNHISDLPQGIFSQKSFQFLEVLNLAHNKLSILPPDFGLTQGNANVCPLKYIDLSYNSIEALPKQCTDHCKQLEVLNLSHNSLKKLPDDFKLKNLQRLFVSFNNLEKLPEHIGECRNLCKIRIISNQIRELPFSMINLWDKRGGKLEEFLPDKNPLIMPSITTFEMAPSNKEGINQAFHLFEQYVEDERIRQEQERAELERMQAALALQHNSASEGDLAITDQAEHGHAGAAIVPVAPVPTPQQASLSTPTSPEVDEYDASYYFGFCKGDTAKIAEIRNAESTLMLVKKNMYVEKLVHLAEKEWIDHVETLKVNELTQLMQTAKQKNYRHHLINKIEHRRTWLRDKSNEGEEDKLLRDDLPQSFQYHLLGDGYDATHFKEKVAVTDVDLYFNLLVMATKPMFSSCHLLFDKFEIGAKGHMVEDEWNEFCMCVPVQLDDMVKKEMWNIMAWNAPKKKRDSKETVTERVKLEDFIAAFHIHDIGAIDPWIARIAQVLKMDYYDMESSELRRRLRAKDAADASPDLDFDTKLGGRSFAEQLAMNRPTQKKDDEETGFKPMDIMENPEGLRRIKYSPLELPIDGEAPDDTNQAKETITLNGIYQKEFDDPNLAYKLETIISSSLSSLSTILEQYIEVHVNRNHKDIKADILCNAPHFSAMRQIQRSLTQSEKIAKALNDAFPQRKGTPISVSHVEQPNAAQDKKDKLLMQVSLNQVQYADYEAIIRGDGNEAEQDSEPESLNSDNLSQASEEEDSDFEATTFLKGREELMTIEQERLRGKAIVVNSDECMTNLMDMDPEEFYRRSRPSAGTDLSISGGGSASSKAAAKPRKRGGQATNNFADPKMKTDVFAVRQAIRSVYRNLPNADFIKLINFLLRGMESIKHSGIGDLTYWHADDPTFKHTMGIVGTNKYTRDLLQQMGFVCLTNIYWIWPACHLDFSAKDGMSWGKTMVTTHCPGRDQHRLDDMICLLRSCHRSLNLKGGKFTGHFKTIATG